MANPQAQANTPQETKAAEKGKKQKQKSSQPGRLHTFWGKRSKARKLGALILFLIALAAAIYLALPDTYQTQVMALIQVVGQSLGATGLRVGVIATLMVGVGACLALLLTPVHAPTTGYLDPISVRSTPINDYLNAETDSTELQSFSTVQRRYPQLSISVIPPVSVYLDAENIVSEQQIPNFLDHLRKTLDGRRADLLFFIDVWDSHRSTYPILSRYGFLPIHAAHNPTGGKKMFEAVDRELAIHAIARALLGPAMQEFIIVSNDGDYAPLISRLLALGHSVQMWSAHDSNPYDALKELVRAFPENKYEFTNISAILGEPSSEQHPAEMRDTMREMERKKRLRERMFPQLAKKAKKVKKASSVTKPTPWKEPQLEQPKSLSLEGERLLYYAIAATLSAHDYIEKTLSAEERNNAFNTLLGSELVERLVAVGYSHASKAEYWRTHLVAIGVLALVQGTKFPIRGTVDVEEGARQLSIMSLVVAEAAANATSNRRTDGYFNMDVILDQLGTKETPAIVKKALNSLIVGNLQRYTHVRCLVHCARKIGFLEFGDVSSSRDLISAPRLTELGERLTAELLDGGQPDTQGATE